MQNTNYQEEDNCISSEDILSWINTVSEHLSKKYDVPKNTVGWIITDYQDYVTQFLNGQLKL